MKQKDTTAYPGLGRYLRDYLRQSLSVLKNPKQLLPTIVLGVIWLVLGIVGSNFWELPLPLWILSFLTYAQGGLYGGLLAAAGGIVGKVVIAAFLNAMIVPLFQGKKPFSGVAGGITGLFRGAAVQGLKEASPLTGGAGAALLLYGFMNSRQDMQEAMVGIVAIIMLLKNIGTKGGFMTGLLFSAAQTFSRGRTPSRITVDRILTGLTIGFTLAVALTLLPFRPCVWTGLVLFVVSIVLAFFGKGGKEPVNKKASMAKPKKGQKALKLNLLAMLFVSGILMGSVIMGNVITAYAAEQWVDPWEYYAAKDISELYPHLRTDKPTQIQVTPMCYRTDDPEKTVAISEATPLIIDLTKNAETEYRTIVGGNAAGQNGTLLIMTFTGDPSSEDLMKVDVTWQGYASQNSSGSQQKSFENCKVYVDEVWSNLYPHAMEVDAHADCSVSLTIDSVYINVSSGGGQLIDLGPYLDNELYEVSADDNIYGKGDKEGPFKAWAEQTCLPNDIKGMITYTVKNKDSGKKIVSQSCWYYLRWPENVENREKSVKMGDGTATIRPPASMIREYYANYYKSKSGRKSVEEVRKYAINYAVAESIAANIKITDEEVAQVMKGVDRFMIGDVPVYHKDDGNTAKYVMVREFPEIPLCYYVGLAKGSGKDLGAVKRKLKEYLNVAVSMPLYVEWFEPEWAPGYDPDTGKLSESGSSGSNGSTDNSGSSGNSGSMGGSMFGSLYDDEEADYDSGSDAGAGDAWTEAYSGGDSSSNVFTDPGYYDLNNGHHAGYYDEYLWDHHVGGMDSALRTLIGWVFSLLFACGVGGTLGGGIGGAIGGSVGGATGGFPGGPGEDLSYEGGGGIPDGQVPGDTAPKDPYHWDNPVPKGWKVNSEGDITYKDPATGERMTYYLTGYDPETGEPQYLSEKSGFTFGESTLRENYDDRGRNAGTLRQDYETGQRWQQEQHAQNQARWEQERVTGKTEMSEAWKRDQEQMSKEQYIEKLAEKYGKSVDDLKGIKKEIIKERVAAETEQQEQMAKDAWLEFGEKTASQIESVADTSINVLGEVTGPAGKTIKNIYTFAKPGLTKLAEAGAQGKDVYETMTMIAQGTAEGAIGVLQNEIDGFGMAIGGDLVKTGLDGVVNGKSMDEITADLTQTAYQSSLNYGIGQLISSAGKKASDKLTAGKSMELGKNIDAYGDYGVSWKNMSVDKANQNMAKMRISDYKKMTAEITKTENWTSAVTNLFSDVFQKNVTGQATELIGETAKAEMQGFLNDSGEVIRRYKRGQDF
ncbi:MAG: hypothetical protein IKE56_03905 [Lachnospiraceae bacterium]|nr:hypothetical protein [Lachnospiraceae bacterium]MBR2531795.1 hypothetical protein [Lachnospiraceae bacterium]